MARKTSCILYSVLIIYFFSLAAAITTSAEEAPAPIATLFDILYTNDGRGAFEPGG